MLDPKLRRFLLKPLRTRRRRVVGTAAYLDALARLDERALGHEMAQRLRQTLRPEHGGKAKANWKDQTRAKQFIELAKALYAARRISTQEYVIYASGPVEQIHDDRWLDGTFDSELKPIKEAIDAIKEKYGLQPDQGWLRGDGPDEYVQLENDYEAILDKKFIELLEEFGLEDLAALRRDNPDEFDRLRERGRRTVFHSDELTPAIRDVVLRYEHDARQAANAGAYSAAIICLGAAIEGLLLLRCLRSKKKAEQVSKNLPKRIRPRPGSDLTAWTLETLIEVCMNSGWLRPVETAAARYDVASLAHVLRSMRNHVHPGRLARERPWHEADVRDYEDASALYVVLFASLGKTSGSRRKK